MTNTPNPRSQPRNLAERGSADEVVLSVRIAATPETVFRYFTDPARFARWMGCGAMGMPPGATTIEARVGGSLRVAYPEGHSAVGTVVEVAPPKRIVFTWGYENAASGLAPGATRVEITLTAQKDATLVMLRHSGLESPEQRAGHTAGWRFFLSVLAGAGSAEQFSSADSAIAAYTVAWNEPDLTKRRAILERCWDPAGSFRDTYGCVDGIDDVNAHIENSRRHMQGMRLATGKAALSHGRALFRWGVLAPNGATVMQGINAARLGLEGRIELLVGFAEPPGM